MLVADSGAIVSDAGGGYGEFDFGAPLGFTPDGEAMFDALVAGFEADAGEAGPPIALDDFGNPVVNTGSAGPGYAVADENMPSMHTVQRGDSLYKIAKEIYGDANMWPLIALANGIETPDLIKSGQQLTLPPKEQFDADMLHQIADGFYAMKEEARQAQMETLASSPGAPSHASPVSSPRAAAAPAAGADLEAPSFLSVSVKQPWTSPKALEGAPSIWSMSR